MMMPSISAALSSPRAGARAASSDGGGDPLASSALSDSLQDPVIQCKGGDPAAEVDPGSLKPSDPGAPLPDGVREKMEGSFGASFSDVRVHVGGQAPSVGAQAYTSGSHLHFAPGRYDPSSTSGQALLGHELAHVVQQRSGGVTAPQAKGAPINANASLESQADSAGARAAAGKPAGIAGASSTPVGEGSVQQLKPAPGAPVAGSVIQRAIGFEFEFGKWGTKHHNDDSPLAKGEEIISGPGFKVEGEDGNEEGSAIEVVTKPFTDAGEAANSVEAASKILQAMKSDGNLSNAGDHGGSANVDVIPKGEAGKFQASPGVSLDKIGDLFEGGVGASYAGFVDNVRKQLNKKSTRKKYLDGGKPSKELEGLVLLTVSYLEQGANKFGLNYPKSAFKVMARTSFTKMFSLMPEHDFFGKPGNRDKWVGLVMSVAATIPSIGKETSETRFKKDWRGNIKRSDKGVAIGKTRKRSKDEMLDAPVLGMKLAGMDAQNGDFEGQAYKSNVTRREWLSRMQDDDLLSKKFDKRFEGMGSYGDATDVEAPEQLDEGKLEQVGEQVGTKVVREKLDSKDVDLPEIDDTPVDTDDKATKEAPLFELRGLRDMFGVDQDVSLSGWGDKVREVFDIVDKANAEKDDKGNVTKNVRFKPGGKPTVAPDTDSPAMWDKVM